MRWVTRRYLLEAPAEEDTCEQSGGHGRASSQNDACEKNNAHASQLAVSKQTDAVACVRASTTPSGWSVRRMSRSSARSWSADPPGPSPPSPSESLSLMDPSSVSADPSMRICAGLHTHLLKAEASKDKGGRGHRMGSGAGLVPRGSHRKAAEAPEEQQEVRADIVEHSGDGGGADARLEREGDERAPARVSGLWRRARPGLHPALRPRLRLRLHLWRRVRRRPDPGRQNIPAAIRIRQSIHHGESFQQSSRATQHESTQAHHNCEKEAALRTRGRRWLPRRTRRGTGPNVSPDGP